MTNVYNDKIVKTWFHSRVAMMLVTACPPSRAAQARRAGMLDAG
jgi:hypothetical protein